MIDLLGRRLRWSRRAGGTHAARDDGRDDVGGASTLDALVTTSGEGFFETERSTFGAHPEVRHHFSGALDEVRVYGRALTAADVAALAMR